MKLKESIQPKWVKIPFLSVSHISCIQTVRTKTICFFVYLFGGFHCSPGQSILRLMKLLTHICRTNSSSSGFGQVHFYAPAIRRMMERAYSLTPVRPSIHLSSHVNNLHFKFFSWRHPCPLNTFLVNANVNVFCSISSGSALFANVPFMGY